MTSPLKGFRAAARQDAIVAGPLGISSIPELVTPTPHHPLTAWIPISDPACVLTLGIAWNEDRYLSLAARAFREHAIAVLDAALPSESSSGSIEGSTDLPSGGT